jgi:hypothetical protein
LREKITNIDNIQVTYKKIKVSKVTKQRFGGLTITKAGWMLVSQFQRARASVVTALPVAAAVGVTEAEPRSARAEGSNRQLAMAEMPDNEQLSPAHLALRSDSSDEEQEEDMTLVQHQRRISQLENAAAKLGTRCVGFTTVAASPSTNIPSDLPSHEPPEPHPVTADGAQGEGDPACACLTPRCCRLMYTAA